MAQRLRMPFTHNCDTKEDMKETDNFAMDHEKLIKAASCTSGLILGFLYLLLVKKATSPPSMISFLPQLSNQVESYQRLIQHRSDYEPVCIP